MFLGLPVSSSESGSFSLCTVLNELAVRGKFKIQMLLDFQPGRNRGRFLMARVSFILQHLSIIRVIVNRLEMIGGSEMYGDFYFFSFLLHRKIYVNKTEIRLCLRILQLFCQWFMCMWFTK